MFTDVSRVPGAKQALSTLISLAAARTWSLNSYGVGTVMKTHELMYPGPQERRSAQAGFLRPAFSDSSKPGTSYLSPLIRISAGNYF